MSGATIKEIIVGIDGSEQAVRAALWAIDEAVSRNATLRLIYVLRTDLSGTLTAAEYVTAVATAKHALGAARERIAERDSAVTVGTKIAQGSPAGVLLAESGDAEMVCVGWSGTNRMAAALMGSTATSVAAGATCPVAIVRTPSDAAGGDPRRGGSSCRSARAPATTARRSLKPLPSRDTGDGRYWRCGPTPETTRAVWTR